MIPIGDENPTGRRAYVTLALIVCNIAIFVGIQMPKSAQAQTNFDYRWAAVPCELRTGKPVVAVPAGAVLAPFGSGATPGAGSCTVVASGITVPQTPFPGKNVWLAVVYSMFLHGSILHVLGNMLFLWIFGNNVEDQLGPVAYLALYLVGGAVASAVHVVGNLDSAVPFLGASGAIAVIMGVYIVWWPRAQVLTLVPIVIIPWLFRLPAFVVLGLWFLFQFFTASSTGIAVLAHIGGFVFGMLVAFALKRGGFPRPRAMPEVRY